jgi:integration host factor subunit beta
MTKREMIAELLVRRPSLSQRGAETATNAVFDAMTQALERGERIEIRGFGSFDLKRREARQGRNPKTAAMVQVKAKRIPFFRAAKELRAEVNGAAEKFRNRTT